MPLSSLLRSTASLLAAAVAVGLAAPAQASMIDQIILNKCSAAMREDFQKAGKTPPDGMVADTCNCVLEQVKNRQSIEQAKTFCSKQSLEKYGQP
ncbi:hypothetical protein [Vulcanococcus sp.]|jgi:hypothetical protein|uniref:hypothetical protein n=1 Tax=Vulcanococcus sp. TaxID=2856995 RepID=UPI0025DFB02D|nr:hypothetical protein [Vulcanococcus sp.]